MTYTKIGFIGLGLIGGSIAKRIRLCFPDSDIIAYDISDNPSLETAVADNVLSSFVDSIESFSNVDLLFLCAPTKANINYLKELKDIISPSCIITDVGSVKKDIMSAAGMYGLSSHFIGGHPMAGSEASGYKNSSVNLLENAFYIISACTSVPDDSIRCFSKYLEDLSFISIEVDPVKHDEYVAAVSHVPHLIAFSLVNLVKNNDSEHIMKRIAAGGFKDITRIASSSPAMWQSICMSNKDCILDYLNRFNDELSSIITCISNDTYDNLYNIFDSAREYRDSIPISGNGIIKPILDIYVDIIDEPGAIASIATILARKSISIKNIEIIHNREFQNGALKIEFGSFKARANAIRILTACDYKIYNNN